MAIVFSAQGVGNVTAAILTALLVVYNVPLEWVWRVAFLFPALTCILTAYPRYKLTESKRFQLRVSEKENKVQEPFLQRFIARLAIIYKYRWQLLGTAGSWFLFDVTFYGNGLFNATVTSILNFDTKDLKYTATFSLVIATIGLPGYFFSILFAERIGRKRIQVMGFVMMTIIFAVMGIWFVDLSTKLPGLFVFLYGLTFFFSNFGPNATTYTIPGEVFPVDVAATCHGMSAAAGKVGAVLGASLFDPMKVKFGLPVVFYACAVIAALGLLLTLVVTTDTRTIHLEKVDEEVEPTPKSIAAVVN